VQLSASGAGGGGAAAGHKANPAAMAELRVSLLALEDRLPWNCVTRAFAGVRGAWRKELGHAATLRAFVRSYRDFMQARALSPAASA
jgi:hypothetical protein